jgi:hypothetical protein
MSTKTVTKRIALATVVALGAGVLSLVSVTSATALDNKKVTDNANAAANIGTMNIATINNAAAPSGTLPGSDSSGARSFGLLVSGDIAGTNTAGVTQTATLLSNGTLTVYSFNGGNSATPFDAIVVSGGTIQTAGSTVATNVTGYINASQTAAVESPTASSGTYTAAPWGATIKPNAGVSSFTVSYYESNTASTTSPTTALASPTSGTLVGYITVSVAAANVGGVISQTKSGIFYTGSGGALTGPFAGVTSDTSTGTPGISGYNVNQTADIRVRDAYSISVANGLTGSSMGVMTAVATNGAYVNLLAPASSGGNVTVANTAGSTTSAYAAAGDNTYMVVSNPTTAPLSTTVTVSYNGVVVGTKSFTFTGKISKVTLSSFKSATAGAGQPATIADPLKGAYGSAAFYDAAGNQVYPVSGDVSYPSSGISKDVLVSGIQGLGISYKAVNATSTGTTVIYNCGAVAAVGSMAIDYNNLDGTSVASNIVTVSCSGKAATYTAKLDKTTYKSGDIAKLTVTFKDSTGTLASDETNTIAATGLVPVFSGTALTPTVVALATDVSTNSVATYTFIVGQPTSDGTFALNVDFPAVDAVLGAAQQVAYTITNGGTSLNDVLKGIVSLIASINKQIAALAKLVTKK